MHEDSLPKRGHVMLSQQVFKCSFPGKPYCSSQGRQNKRLEEGDVQVPQPRCAALGNAHDLAAVLCDAHPHVSPVRQRHHLRRQILCHMMAFGYLKPVVGVSLRCFKYR